MEGRGWLAKLPTTLAIPLLFAATGNKLVRGYKEPAMPEEGQLPPISHFIFAIHGIGQKLDTNEVRSVVKTTIE